MKHSILDVSVDKNDIKSIYSFYSRIYFVIAAFEKRPRMRSIEMAEVQPDDKILEIAVGAGHSFIQFLGKVNRENVVHGVDLTPAMLEKTKERVARNGYSNFDLREADARSLPFLDESFDLVYSSYMMDLIPTGEFLPVLREFRRVLKKCGRLVLVNLSKKNQNQKPILWERLYLMNPYILGGCRPVMLEPFVKEAGFSNLKREFHPSIFLPTEIVAASK